MKSIILRGKIRNSLTLLITILVTIIGSQLSLQAGRDQLLFDMDAIQDPGSLIVKLQDTRAPVSKFIASQLSEDMQWILLGYNGTSSPSAQQQEGIAFRPKSTTSNGFSLRYATVH